MSISRRSRPSAKELFMSNVRQHSRACAFLHCAFILRPISNLQIIDPDNAAGHIANMLRVRKGMRIHLSTSTKIIVSFAHHAEAYRALSLAVEQRILNIEGCPYQFLSADEIAHVRSVKVDQRVSITLRNLPLHMWTSAIVEQILSPYCALEYINQETRTMDDLSGYNCIAWCERTLEIPDQLTIMVPQDIAPTPVMSETTATSMPLYKYTVYMDKFEYLHGITARCEYESAPMVSTGHIVYPAQCYILPKLLDTALIHKYSSAVILVVQPDCYFATVADLYSYLDRELHIRVNVKLLKNGSYLLYVDRVQMYTSLYSLLSAHLQEWIQREELQLFHWSPQYGSVNYAIEQAAPQYGSVNYAIEQAVQLKIKGLPCNLNTPPVIEHMMSPFVLVTTHHTTISDTDTELGNTIIIYECSAWCRDYQRIPSALKIKLLPAASTSLTYVSSESEQECPSLDVSVLVQRLHIM